MWQGWAAGNAVACRVDGAVYRLASSTPVLLDALAAGATLAVWPGCLPAAQADRIWARLYDPGDPLDLHHVERVAAGVVQALAGWPAPGARLLATVAGEQWPLLAGRAAGQGAGDLLARPVHVVLGYVYSVLIDGCDTPADRERLRAQLARPADPPGALYAQTYARARAARNTARAAAVAAAQAPAPVRGIPAPPGHTVHEENASFRGMMAALAGLSGSRS